MGPGGCREEGKAAIGGGGLIGLIVALVVVLAGGGGLGGLSALEDQSVGAGGAGPNQELREECVSGVDANTEADCRIVGVVNSVQSYWSTALQGYQPAQTVFFSDEVDTACGTASSAVRPVLLPRRSPGVHRPRLLLAAAGELRRAREVPSPRRT